MTTLFSGMGSVLARAWTDDAFAQRLLGNPAAALREIAIHPPEGVSVSAYQAGEADAYLVLAAPPIVVPRSPFSDIATFACIYRDPALWSLNWLGRDPVETKRFLADPAGALTRLGVTPPSGMTVHGLANTTSAVHLVLPPRPPDPLCTPAMVDNLKAGRALPAMRFGRLFGTGAYAVLAQRLSRPLAGTLHESASC